MNINGIKIFYKMFKEPKCKVVSIEELKKGNERLCLSPLRVFGKCHECEVMKRYYKDKTGKVKSCESAIINPEYLKLMEQEKEQLKKLKKIQEELKNN